MKCYDVLGYTYDADIWCEDCLPVDPEDDDTYPIFADSEWDYQPCCNACGMELEGVTVLGESAEEEEDIEL